MKIEKKNIISDWLNKYGTKEMNKQVEKELENMFTSKVFNENCLDTMARMPDKFINLTVTSPPYDGLRAYNGYSFDFESIAKELYRVTKDGGVVVWIVGDKVIKGSESGTSFKQALFFKECGFNLHDTMIYNRSTIPLTHNRYEQEFEYMFIFSKGKPNTFNPIKIDYSENTKKRRKTKYTNYKHRDNNEKGVPSKLGGLKKYGRIKGNIWNYKVGNHQSTKDKIAFKHPAIFPEKLANDHIISWSNEGDVIYDCFMGSGTTAKMAIINKRKWIGSEMSSEYCEIIDKRLNDTGTLF
jgi:site-specific DNA-methyltransferase (adenine-specific)